MGAAEITRFLTWLAVDGKVAASTQNQALGALVFLYREVLELEVPWLNRLVRAKRPRRLPVVLTRDEVRAVLGRLEGVVRLMAYLLYGAGLRLLECSRLRVQDIDFAANQIIVRGGKGDTDRVTMLPNAVKADLARHLEVVLDQHRRDVEHGAGWVELPMALARKYPSAGREWPWHWIFPATRMYVDPTTRQRRRHHLHESVVQRAVKDAARRAGLAKQAGPHTLRHSFATHLHNPRNCGEIDRPDIPQRCDGEHAGRASRPLWSKSRPGKEIRNRRVQLTPVLGCSAGQVSARYTDRPIAGPTYSYAHRAKVDKV